MNSFRKALTNPFKFKLFKLKELPLAYVAGLKIKEFTDHKAVVRIKHTHWTKNPFRSIYFAAQAMAAEMSTGALVMDQVQQAKPEKISMLVYTMRADFSKKATGEILFTCEDGHLLQEVMQKVLNDEEGQTIELKSTGRNDKGEVVSTFYFTWTLKKK